MKDRLLIASTHSNFLQKQLPKLREIYEVQVATTLDMTLFLCTQWDPRVCIIDSDSELFSVCSNLRQKHPHQHFGLIALTNKVDMAKEERALSAGCDHYLSMADDDRHLYWRVRSLFARGKLNGPVTVSEMRPTPSEVILLGNLSIHPDTNLVKRSGSVVGLSPTHFRLLLVFLTHRDELLSRESIKSKVWANSDISSRTIDAQISKLRKIVPELDYYLMNVYGKGYVLTREQRAA